MTNLCFIILAPKELDVWYVEPASDSLRVYWKVSFKSCECFLLIFITMLNNDNGGYTQHCVCSLHVFPLLFLTFVFAWAYGVVAIVTLSDLLASQLCSVQTKRSSLDHFWGVTASHTRTHPHPSPHTNIHWMSHKERDKWNLSADTTVSVYKKRGAEQKWCVLHTAVCSFWASCKYSQIPGSC